MRRPAINPFMATGIAMIGAATIVANPVITPPADIRISASDQAANTNSLASIDFGLLDSIGSIGAARSGSPSTVLNRVLSFGITDETAPLGYNSLNDALGRAAEKDPILFIGVLAFNSPSGAARPGLPSAPDMVMSPGDLLRALAGLSSGFGEAGAAFVQEAGMTPAVIIDLARQVLAGTMAPDDALRRLLAAPLSARVGPPGLTDIPENDAIFSNGLLKTIIDVLVANSPPELGGGVDGLINTIANLNVVGIPAVRESQETAVTAASVTGSTAETDSTDGTSKETDQTAGADTSDTTSATNSQPTRGPAEVFAGIRDRVQQTLDDLTRKNHSDSGTAAADATDSDHQPVDAAESIRERVQQSLDDLTRRTNSDPPAQNDTPAPNKPKSSGASGAGAAAAGSPGSSAGAARAGESGH